jgi:hypothetical protein
MKLCTVTANDLEIVSFVLLLLNVETFWNKDEYKLISRTYVIIEFIFFNKNGIALPGSSNMAASLPREINSSITAGSSVETGCRSPS